MQNESPIQIGRNIQEVRKKKHLTISQLSISSGVSKAMISQIETGKTNPTVATVWRLSQGLNVELEQLLRDKKDSVRRFDVSRKELITTLDTGRRDLSIKVLSPFNMVEDLEIYLLTFQPGGVLKSTPHFPKTEEYLTVVKGEVRVVAGENSTDLRSGDFINYHCDIHHSIENISDTEAVVHMVVRFFNRRR